MNCTNLVFTRKFNTKVRRRNVHTASIRRLEPTTVKTPLVRRVIKVNGSTVIEVHLQGQRGCHRDQDIAAVRLAIIIPDHVLQRRRTTIIRGWRKRNRIVLAIIISVFQLCRSVLNTRNRLYVNKRPIGFMTIIA